MSLPIIQLHPNGWSEKFGAKKGQLRAKLPNSCSFCFGKLRTQNKIDIIINNS